MRTLIGLAAAGVVAAAGGAAMAAQAGARLSGPSGQSGAATLREGSQGVVMRVELSGLTSGWHAIHFHEKGDCADPKFTSAGGHINHATKRPHGLLNPQGPDFGDLPNVFVGADGTARAEVYSPLVSLKGAAGRPALLDADGSALVVHANADDQTSQPIGGAGDRVACGVIRAAGE
jgi:superoxide dismutase, Cu-Zn family